MYGAQTLQMAFSEAPTFENDVEMYGAQTLFYYVYIVIQFENDVEMYGAQTLGITARQPICLRMMQKCMVLKHQG